MSKGLRQGSAQAIVAEARVDEHRKLILRAGLLEQDGRTSFCLVKDISISGMKVKLYSTRFAQGSVTVRVADEKPIQARIAWIEDDHAGIQFELGAGRDMVLRLREKLKPAGRRSLPRLKAAARALIRIGGRSFPAELCDISSFGAKIRTRRRLPTNHTAIIDLPDLPSIRAFVRWSDDCDSGLLFATPIPTQVIGQWVDGRLRVSA